MSTTSYYEIASYEEDDLAVAVLDHPDDAHLERHLPPINLARADEPLDSVVAAAARDDMGAVAELRWRSCALVSDLLTQRLGSSRDADALLSKVFDAILGALPSLNQTSDFSRWLLEFVPSMPLDATAPTTHHIIAPTFIAGIS